MRAWSIRRVDLYAIADDLEFIKSQLARVPTPRQLAQTALGIIFCAAGSRDRVVRVVLALTASGAT
jgi:hypothetical protein